MPEVKPKLTSLLAEIFAYETAGKHLSRIELEKRNDYT